jgi:hypothetical protein
MFHQIRIEIKKIKAVLRLLHHNQKNFRSHKAYLPFRALFRACGEIREPFVIQGLIDKFKGFNTPIVVDLNLTSNIKNHLLTYIRTIKRSETEILTKTGKIKSSTYKDFLKKNKIELKNLLYPTFLQRDLHKIRKLIKEIYYLSSIRSKRKNINSFYVTSADLIGNWHDKKTVIQKLRKSVPLETELIQTLKTENRSDISALKKLVQNFYK